MAPDRGPDKTSVGPLVYFEFGLVIRCGNNHFPLTPP